MYLEGHMFQKMCNTIVVIVLKSTASINPQTNLKKIEKLLHILHANEDAILYSEEANLFSFCHNKCKSTSIH